MTTVDLKDAITYALGGDVPETFLDHLVKHSHLWDNKFIDRLDECAYELCPELAIWEIKVTEENKLIEKRLPLVKI